MTTQPWWQTAVFYQIYPRSFADGNGDGIGDLIGASQRLDYLQDLGVDAIWLSPHYPSPNYDCGYDIADYTAVAPEYGSLRDFKQFLHNVHRRGIRVILDLVLNHTSHLHPWFQESRSSLNNPKRDWYVWKKRPNNWNSCFDGAAWEVDPITGEYYYHYFLKQQPDLNWRNPAVKSAMWDAARFWLDLGVDGYRLDAIGTIYEDPAFTEHQTGLTLAELRQALRRASSPEERKKLEATWELMFKYQVDQPGVHELMQELRSVVSEFGDCLLIGEDDRLSYLGDGDNELQLVFNFPLMRTERMTPSWVRANQDQRLAELRAISPTAWPCNTLGNHDSSRVYTRFGDGKNDDALARLHIALLLTLRGTPFLYNGEEIGMSDYRLPEISQFRDTLGVWLYEADRQLFGLSHEEALAHAAREGRDKCRTPMQWQNSAHGGFCPAKVQPWLPVNPNYTAGVNVADQLQDPQSLINVYRRLLHYRAQTPALKSGDYTPIRSESDQYLAFLRRCQGQTCLVVLNFSPNTLRLSFPELAARWERRFALSVPTGPADLREIVLAPWEAHIYESHA